MSFDISFIIRGEIIHNDVQTMTQVFLPNTGFQLVDTPPSAGLCLDVRNDGVRISAQLFDCGDVVDATDVTISGDTAKAVNRAVKLAIHNLLSRRTDYKPPWGLLTGIRPAKIATTLFEQGASVEDARRELMDFYMVEPRRAVLCTQVAAAQQGIINAAENNVSVYIGVPFCPSVCQYCSFSSYPRDKFGKYMADYVDALVKEICYLGQAAQSKFVENIYIGGGTPTALSDTDFEKMLAAIANALDTTTCLEYSVEAGRPDTITAEKLALMLQYNVGRISINPQTLNDDTLIRIGRGHTAADFYTAYELAQTAGFRHINIDLIIGLAGEGTQDVERTLQGIAALSPNAVTIHTMTVKRASRLRQELDDFQPIDVATMEEMLALAADYMASAGLQPYYMYRQKNSLGNFENVGYSTVGYEGRYNVQIMEERQSVLAAGAGAVTKLVTSQGANERIKRIFNLRNPVDYIRRVDEMISRKMEEL